MRILGVDPGTAITGYGVLDVQGPRLTYRAHGTLTTRKGAPAPERLHTLHTLAERLLVEHRPDLVVVERLYFKQNVTTGLAVAEARGVLILAAAQAGIPVVEYSPTEVKTAVTGYGRAEKRQMQEMVRLLLGLDERPRPDDAADALALAICCAHSGGKMRYAAR
jgi:crossover junction endodeoxyribonuclease RuvC